MPDALVAMIRTRVARDFEIDLRFEAPPGITVLLGPSGAGKSTTLAAIAGFHRPDNGRIALGRDLWFDSSTSVDRPVELRKIAFVFQSLALFPHMSALDNVEYGVDRSLSRGERRARAESMLERMRVAHVRDRKPRTFSGGEAQRVALARAFAVSPKVVLLDEPFSALDRDLRKELCVDVKQAIKDLGIPAVLVTHHRNEARFLGDRAILIERGRIVAEGSTEEVLGEEEGGGPRSGGSLQDFAETPLGEV